ncbi:MAG TPA: helix-turn-helix domain-containing protein [Steroidobacteraceae bacterium]|nr:helix-turn-helix domain-containing protein [Steroidobacteraceae bacterium]
MSSIESLRSHVEGYPDGGRIPRHAHDWDQLALISGSAAVVETGALYVVHPLLKGLWLPAGIEHSVYSPRPFYLHSLYFEAGSVRSDPQPQVLGLDNLARELILLLCTVPQASKRGARHVHALGMLEEILPEAKPESFSLPRPRHERARLLADYFTTQSADSRPVEIIAGEIGGASLRTFERLFAEETGLSLATWRRHSRLLASLSLLAQGKSIGEVAHAVGYESAAAFSAAFKQCFGVSPSAYG